MKSSKWIALLFVACLLYWFAPTTLFHLRRTFDPFVFNDDARILIWPFFRDADPTLYPADPFVTYFQAGLPEGYLALYHALGKLGIAGSASEWLPYLLMLVTLGFVTVSAHRLGGATGAFLSAVMLLGSFSVYDRLGGGLPRAFAFPIVAAGAFALVSDRPRLLACLAVLGAAFYPVVAALLGLALLFLLVLPSRLRTSSASQSVTHAKGPPTSWTRHLGKSTSWLRNVGKSTSWKSRVALLVFTLVGIAAVLAPTALRLRPYGATITQDQLLRYPEAGPGGRLGPEQQAPFPPWYKSAAFHAKQALLGTGEPLGGKALHRLRETHKRANVLVAGVIGLAALSLGVRAYRRRKLAPELARLFALLLALIVGYTLASLVTPRLFLPERYAQYAAPILTLLVLAAGFGQRPLEAGVRTRLSAVASFGLTLLVVLLLGGRGTSWVGIEVWIAPEERSLYAELAQLPKESVIAGWPLGPLENIPYLSKRRVLTNYQLEMPFHQRFCDDTRKRLTALFEAYFATDRAPVVRLGRDFGVTHVLVDPALFGPEVPTYYRPFDVEVWRLYAIARSRPRLLELAQDPRIGRKIGRYYLVDIKQVGVYGGDSGAIVR